MISIDMINSSFGKSEIIPIKRLSSYSDFVADYE